MRFFYILFCLSAIFVLQAERYSLQTELDEFIFTEKLISESPERYRLLIIDLFSNNEYEAVDPPATLHHLEILYRSPLESQWNIQKRTFELEQILLGSFGTIPRSLQFHYLTEIPGKQNYFIKRKTQIFISGVPFLYSLWVYANESHDVLYLKFKNLKNQKLLLKIGNLDWKGWRRIQGQFPENFMYYPKLNKPQPFYSFEGFFIQTTQNSSVGAKEILLCQFYIISSYESLLYPGSEQLDNF